MNTLRELLFQSLGYFIGDILIYNDHIAVQCYLYPIRSEDYIIECIYADELEKLGII